MTKARHGIYAAAISPFAADGSLDAAKSIAYCRNLVGEGGCDGVAPLGTNGEGNSIAFRERLALPAAFAESGLAPDQVIFGTGACAVADATAFTRAALDAGFPNVLVLPPFYYKSVGEDGLYAYFARLIEGVGDDRLRVYLYHFPKMSMTPIPVDVVTRLKAAFGPLIAGLKDSSGDLGQSLAFVEATGGSDADFDVFPSSEALLFDALAAGCAGIISGSANAFARKARAARDATGADREPAIAAVKAARALAERYPMIAAMKRIEAWRTGDEGWLRVAPPLVPLTATQEAELRTELDALESATEPATAT